jgi:hypothetical protein
MFMYRARRLVEEANARVPSSDPFGIETTALPSMAVRHDRQVAWMAARADRFSQMLARSSLSEFVEDKLVSRRGITEAERQEVLALAPDAARLLDQEVEELMRRLRASCATADPLLLVAQIAINHTFGGWGEYSEPTSESSEAAVETVAGIASTLAAGQFEPPPSTLIQQVEDLLDELSRVQTLAIMARGFALANDEGHLKVGSQMRFTTVRGESYVQHGRDVATAILRPVNDWMRAGFGFTFDEFLAVAEAVCAMSTESYNDHMNSHLTRIDSFQRLGDDLTDSQRDQARAAFDSLFAGMPKSMVFSLSDLATFSGLELQLVEAVARELSTSIGELEEDRFRSPLVVSPIADRPFLRDGDRYLVPIAGLLLRSPHELFETRLLSRFPKFSEHRARVVDELSIEMLTDALPGSTSATNAYYSFDDGDGIQRYETDGVVLFENYVLIVEGKASKLSVASRRGDLERLRRDIGRSLDEAWQQCSRVDRYLNAVERITFMDKRGHVVLDSDNPRNLRVLYIVPTLHSLGTFAFEIPRLRELGLFASSGMPWPVMVTDLRVVTEMCATPSELLHYIDWRVGLPIGDSMSVADELDVLGAYMFGRVGETNVKDNELMIFANSTMDFDKYYFGEAGDGPQVDRPSRVLGDFGRQVVNDLAIRRPRGWLETSFVILDLSLTEVAALDAWATSRGYRDIRNRRWASMHIENTVFVALADGVTPTEVVLELASHVPHSARRIMLELKADGPRLVAAQRTHATLPTAG